MAGTAGFEYDGDKRGGGPGTGKGGGGTPEGGMDPQILKAGLLMEAAEAQQKAAQDAVHRFEVVANALVPLIERAIERGLTRHVDAAVRQAVANMAAEELKQVQDEARRAAVTLQRLRDQARQGLTIKTAWLSGLVALGVSFTVVILLFLLDALPTWTAPAALPERTVAHPSLRGDPAALAEIERRGLVVEVGFCGDKRRVCARVESKAAVGRD